MRERCNRSGRLGTRCVTTGVITQSIGAPIRRSVPHKRGDHNTASSVAPQALPAIASRLEYPYRLPAATEGGR